MTANIWLVDADNQSPALAAQTAAILGWPHTAIIVGLAPNIRAWKLNAHVPDTVEIEYQESPLIPDGADVLLAMAAGRWVGKVGHAVIFSRDGLVAGTLGQILDAQGVRVIAVSAINHPGLPYPHLTLPGDGAKRAYAPSTVSTAKNSVFTVESAPSRNISSDAQSGANAVMGAVFASMPGACRPLKAAVGQVLCSLGYGSKAARAELLAAATEYREGGTGPRTFICRKE
jgi:hypothetical protein